MSDLEVIRDAVDRSVRRRRIQGTWLGSWRGLLGAGVIWLGVLAVYKLFPVPELVLLWGAAAALLVWLGGGLAGLWRRPGQLQMARWVDDRQHLQERLSTALEFADQKGAGRWRELVIADAAEQARGLDVRRVMPMILPRVARWCLLVLALGAGLGFVPEYRSEAYLQKEQEGEIIRETGRQLEELVKRQLQTRPPALESTQAALESVQELGQELGRVRLDRNQALTKLASVTDRLQQQLQELGSEPGVKRLDQGSRQGPMGDLPTPEGLRKRLEAMREKLGQSSGDPESLGELQRKLDEIQQAAAAMSESDGAAADALGRELSESMAELAQQAEEMGVNLAGLEEAMKALSDGDVGQMLRDLDASFLDLERLSKMAQAMQNLEQQLAEMGRDLSEQLEKGQGLAAYSTLKRMIRELEQADLGADQLGQLLEEVAQAVEPGSDYGQVGDFLRQATEQLRSGQNPAAASSLAEAAEEIKRLMEQMGDYQEMMAALQGLQMGQMCIGNGMAWGLCRGAGARPGQGSGGPPGGGVGTWGDDDLWMDPQETGLWDNSGIQRPDLDPRGLTDRGEGELNDALTPTKVRGQISPGGPMPSITLRGLSIRGQSRVDYQERVAAAQSDAQSALNQDLVPRAYRGAVRDYFDDLK